jgi:CubicO group peptidase (beta-lactamase class C family)
LRRMKFIAPAYSLRSSYIYQNLMYMVAGEVIKKVSGKSWDEFITERIFKPLGMNNTYADYSTIAPTTARTTPHFKDKDNRDTIKAINYLSEDNVGAAGGVWSCADDMSKWLQFLLDSAQLNGKRLLKPETFAELFRPQAIVPVTQFYPTAQLTHPHWMTYGLGWFQHDYRGKMVQFHTGSLDGLVAIAGMIPDEHMAVYIFGNLDHSEIRHALMYKAFDLWCFHDNKNDWGNDLFKLYTGLSDTAKKREEEQAAKRVMNTHPSFTLSTYTGKYVSELYGNAEITFTNDSLVLKLPDHISLSLRHWNYDTFQGYYNNWWFGKSVVQFLTNAEGSISGFSMDGILFNKETPK